MTPHPLEEEWRARAAKLTAWGAARLWELAAAELAAFEAERALKVLCVAAAAQEAGVSPDTVRRAIAEKRVENVGKKRRPLIRRQDLPKLRRPRKATPRLPCGDPDLNAKVREGQRETP
jgi:hypothetical protein